MIYPQNFEQKIGFDEIRTLLTGHCLSTLGIERVVQMKFLTDLHLLRELQEQTREFLRIQEGEEESPSTLNWYTALKTYSTNTAKSKTRHPPNCCASAANLSLPKAESRAHCTPSCGTRNKTAWWTRMSLPPCATDVWSFLWHRL